jgi:hypothetical protein
MPPLTARHSARLISNRPIVFQDAFDLLAKWDIKVQPDNGELEKIRLQRKVVSTIENVKADDDDDNVTWTMPVVVDEDVAGRV